MFAVVDSTGKCTSTSTLTFWFVAWSLYSWVEEDIDEDEDEDAWSGTTSSCC